MRLKGPSAAERAGDSMLDWVIVGGGPHGVHLAIRLLAEAGVDRTRLRIVDPGPRLLHTWRRSTSNTGMTHLRSPGVHHLDLDPFSLIRFASAEAYRGSSTGSFARPYNRPAVDLFTQHCDQLIEDYYLTGLHVQSRVSSIRLEGEGTRLKLTQGEDLLARRVLLALGSSEQPRWPEWAKTLPEESVSHVLEPGFALEPDSCSDRVAVVGAGITAAQVSLRLAGAGKQVTLLSRHGFREHLFDSDPGWLGPKSMKRFANTPDPQARRRMIDRARHRGSVPPDLHRSLKGAIRDGRIRWVKADSVEATPESTGGIELVADGTTIEIDQVLLATGFESHRPGGELVDDLVETLALPCATCGFPLVDHHLRWHPCIFVTGPLAELEVGPVSRNLVGARRAASRIMPVAMG